MNLLEFFGKFHPLAVHLPIGILTIFLFLALFIPRKSLQNSFSIIRLILLVSALSATASSISGLLLSNYNSYDLELVSFHQWSGISLTILNWMGFFKIEYLLIADVKIYRSSLIIILAGLIITGHAGGSLTHGSDFLNPPPPSQWFSSSFEVKKNIAMSTTAFEASSIILEKKCFVCHGKNKQKGELRLDTRDAILKGGENGKIIADNAANSIFVERLLLPLDHEDHMPPKEKKQLTQTEINFLMWWVESGANFDLTLSELELPDSLNGILTREEIKIIDNTIPEENIDPLENHFLVNLRSLNIVISPLGASSNYLSASFVNVLPEDLSVAIDNLSAIGSHLIWLNLDYQNLEDETWTKLGMLTNLRKLSVRNSNLDDSKLANLVPLDKLAHLNLVGTFVTVSGIQKLEKTQTLESLYLYQTKIEKSEFKSLKILFPNAKIDTGNYVVPTLESDTTLFAL